MIWKQYSSNVGRNIELRKAVDTFNVFSLLLWYATKRRSFDFTDYVCFCEEDLGLFSFKASLK